MEFQHGSRVVDFQPLILFITQLAKPGLLAKGSQAMLSQPAAAAAAATVSVTAAPSSCIKSRSNQVSTDMAESVTEQTAEAVSLSEQILRLMQAIVFAHEQVTGAAC